MSVSFALIGDNPKSLRTERDRKAFFTPEGKVRVIARETDRSAREEAMRCSMLLRKRQQDFLQGERKIWESLPDDSDWRNQMTIPIYTETLSAVEFCSHPAFESLDFSLAKSILSDDFT